MDAKRKGEIAYILLKDEKRRDGIRFDGLKRDLGNIASRTGISLEELKEFAKEGIKELTDEALS